MTRTERRSRSPAVSVGETFADQSMSSADAELIMAAVDGIFALSDVFDAAKAIKAIARYKKTDGTLCIKRQKGFADKIDKLSVDKDGNIINIDSNFPHKKVAESL